MSSARFAYAPNDSESYECHAESLRKHAPQEELKAMIGATGCERCDDRNLSAGSCAIHSGYGV